MPKPGLKNPFARRKSSGNVLEVESPSTEASSSSFRVIERPEKSKIVFDGTNRSSQIARPFSSPLQQLRGKSVDDLTYHTNGSVDTAASRKAASALKPARGSGGTTNSGSSEFYQSSSASGRYSSSSTLPSSVEHELEDDELFAQKRPQPATYRPTTARLDEPLPPPPSFSARAQRAFSFGMRNKQSQDRETTPPIATPTAPPPPPHSYSPARERALTTSSYASTAVPTTLDIKDLGASDFGGDFGKMFEDEAKSPVVESPQTDAQPLFPPRSYTRQDTSSPSAFKTPPTDTGSPWKRRTSRDGLLASAATSPDLLGSKSGFFSESNHFNAASSTARASEESQDTTSSGKTYELRDAQDTSRLPLSKSVTTPALSTQSNPISPFAGDRNPWESESSNATPKASKQEPVLNDDESLFDASPVGPPSRATRPAAQSRPDVAPRRLTKAQFDILQRYDKNMGGDEDDGGNSDGEYEDDDEIERAKQLTQQRRKQEANMSVYRQQMKKVTGGGPTDLPVRPGLDTRSSSVASLHVGGIPGAPPSNMFVAKPTNDDDDDVPLGILQAHGFPSASRPPTQFDSYRPPSVVGQRSSGNLPPFARRLPQDPYFGAGLVNPAARESLAYGGGGSVYGGPSAPVSPGGLVGIIANEEQQRQARRGSPNPATGNFNSMPLPQNMPGMIRSPSMGSVQMPGFYPQMPGMPMMPPMPMTNDPQMQEFMQMQMQFMQNMQMMMMQQQQPQPQGFSPPGAIPPGGAPRPMSSMGVPQDGRTMSMLGVPQAWNGGMASRPTSTLDPRVSMYTPSVNGLAGPGVGYQPSIAPSERSNVGMPTRYRPVQTEESRTNSLTSSLTLNAFSNQQAARPGSQAGDQRKSTIRVVDKPKSLPKLARRSVEHDEDEESWADMIKKKVTGKRSARASRSGGERVALSELYPNVE